MHGCGNKDKILLEQVPATPVVNPDTRILVKNNTLLSAHLDSAGAIRGLSSNCFFVTTDFFAHFNIASYSLPGTMLSYNFDKDTMAFATGNALLPTISYSDNDGGSWLIFTPVLLPALATTYSSTKLVSLVCSGKQTVLALFLQTSNTGSYTRSLYKINTYTNEGTMLSTSQDAYQATTVKFTDAKNGWMLLNYAGTYLSATTDGGSTWSAPAIIDIRTLAYLQPGGNGTVAVFDGYGTNWFSANAGASWKKSTGNYHIAAVSVVSNSVVYALTDTGVMKSTDGGISWNTVANFDSNFNNVQKLFFRNELQGLAYSSQRLYITMDGGKSWKTLLYPYPYIIQ